MARYRILELQQSAEGVWEYIPDPDESEVKQNLDFLTSMELALRLVPINRSGHPLVTAQDLSLDTIINILPEWLKDTIYAISVLAELLTSRFMVDGKWVKFSKWRIGWNFMSLIMIYKAAKDIVKAFKKPSE